MRQRLTLFFYAIIVLFSASSFATAPKTWTFLIYLNGDNSLDSYGKLNILDMEKVGSNDKVNIVVQWASLQANKTVRLLVLKSTNPNKVTSPIIENMGVVDMGSYKNLEDFIAWGVKNYPAEHYFINVWNHGSGWHAMSANAVRSSDHLMGDISWDDNTGHSISTIQLGQVMDYAAKLIGHKVDIYGSDACLMAMAEIADQMKNSVEYYVGSQEVEPGAGWPYTPILSRWEALPDESSDAIAKILVEEYVNAYDSRATMSAFNLNYLETFNQSVKKLSDELLALNPADRATELSIAKRVRRFDMNDYADLMDFVAKLKSSSLKIDHSTLNQVLASSKALVIANAASQPKYKNAHGISIWLPVNSADYKSHADIYKKLTFNLDTGWNDALSVLLQGTH